MNKNPDSADFYLEPTNDPMRVRLMINDGSSHEHIIVVESSFLKKLGSGAALRFQLVRTAIDFVLSIEPHFRFPDIISLRLLSRLFPDLENRLKLSLNAQGPADTNALEHA
jgi:hypothetical protein